MSQTWTSYISTFFRNFDFWSILSATLRLIRTICSGLWVRDASSSHFPRSFVHGSLTINLRIQQIWFPEAIKEGFQEVTSHQSLNREWKGMISKMYSWRDDFAYQLLYSDLGYFSQSHISTGFRPLATSTARSCLDTDMIATQVIRFFGRLLSHVFVAG